MKIGWGGVKVGDWVRFAVLWWGEGEGVTELTQQVGQVVVRVGTTEVVEVRGLGS